MRVRKDSTITLPLVDGQNDIVQLVADIREKNTLTWSDITVIHDGSLTSFNMDLLLKMLSMPTDKAMHVSLLVVDISDPNTAEMK